MTSSLTTASTISGSGRGARREIQRQDGGRGAGGCGADAIAVGEYVLPDCGVSASRSRGLLFCAVDFRAGGGAGAYSLCGVLPADVLNLGVPP